MDNIKRFRLELNSISSYKSYEIQISIKFIHTLASLQYYFGMITLINLTVNILVEVNINLLESNRHII